MRSILLLLLLCFSFLSTLTAQKKEEPLPTLATDAGMVQKMVNTLHCCSRTTDDQYYRDVARLFLRYMDPLRIYFTQDDMKHLRDMESLKEELSGKSHAYSDLAVKLYKQGLTRASDMITEVAESPFDFTLNEEFYLKEDSSDFASDDKEQRKRIYKLVKFMVLDRLMEGELADSSESNIALKEREAKVREVVVKKLHRRIKNRLETRLGTDNLVKAMLDDVVLKTNDPHSQFTGSVQVKARAKREYGSAYSFGLDLEENYKGDVVVVGVVPGSSAWRSGEINVDDILISLQWEDPEPTLVDGMELYDIEQMITEKRSRKMKVTVRKPDQQLKTVTLTRERVSYGSTGYVSGYKLVGSMKFAYVVLPSFYRDWSHYGGSSCARDVNKVLEKLQFEVDGLILDMRNNGGGSMGEANEMAGIFIDEGTLGFSKQKLGFSTEMKDPYLGTLYQEPIVVLVNSNSASATEYVAAALQDYNRAVIVGSPTFGKATMQCVIPADTSLDRADFNHGDWESDVRDRLRLTIGKLYRPTGRSNQLRGVIPDIILPTVIDSVCFRECNLPNVLEADTIHRKGVYDKFAPLPIEQLRAKSAQRISTTPGFKLVDKGQQLLAQMKRIEDKPLSLQYDKYMGLGKKYYDPARKLIKQIRQDSTAVYQVSVYPEPEVDPRAKPDLVEEEIKDKVLKRIASDIYVKEAYYILSDMVNIKNGKN
jgi:carboxyl-terminal processing protease